jgi:hypothetical protein
MTGTVGLTPLDVGIFAAGVFLIMLVVQIIGAIRGRTSFTLDNDQ